MGREPGPDPWSSEDFRPIAALLLRRHGPVLTPHRLELLQARLQVRLRARGIPSFSWYHTNVLQKQPNGPGMQMLIDLSTVNHTSFFREPESLDALADDLADRLRSGGFAPIRVWSAGCSGGQEPYSVAMCLLERMTTLTPDRLEIWASDTSLGMVRSAARAMYDERVLSDITSDRLRRFFLRGRGPRHGQFRLAPEVRNLVRFVHFDLRSGDWPVPSDFDAILCRNVAIYFEEDERLVLMERLARRLLPGGWLVVGNCEIFPELTSLLEKHGPSLFRKGAAS